MGNLDLFLDLEENRFRIVTDSEEIG